MSLNLKDKLNKWSQIIKLAQQQIEKQKKLRKQQQQKNKIIQNNKNHILGIIGIPFDEIPLNDTNSFIIKNKQQQLTIPTSSFHLNPTQSIYELFFRAVGDSPIFIPFKFQDQYWLSLSENNRSYKSKILQKLISLEKKKQLLQIRNELINISPLLSKTFQQSISNQLNRRRRIREIRQQTFEQDNNDSRKRTTQDFINQIFQLWGNLLAIQSTIQYFIHKYNQNNQNKETANKQNNKYYLQIINTLIQIYQSKIKYIYNNILQQGLNDINNNYYISQKNKYLQIINLLFFTQWTINHNTFNLFNYVYSIIDKQQPINISDILNLTFNQQSNVHKFRTNKLLNIDQLLLHNQQNQQVRQLIKSIEKSVKSINGTLQRMIKFYSKQEQNYTLLSEQQYTSKIQPDLHFIVSNFISNHFYLQSHHNYYKIKQQQSHLIKNIIIYFIKSLFISFYVNTNLKSQQLNATNKSGLLNKQIQILNKQIQILNKYKNQIKLLSYNNIKLLNGQLFKHSIYPINPNQFLYKFYSQIINKSIIYNNSFSPIQYIKKIFFNNNSQQKQLFQQTFQFQSPTFNDQLLTYKYIFGQIKHIHFYQNHHYSHILLQLYSTSLTYLLQLYQNQLNNLNKGIQISKQQIQKLMIQIFNKLRNCIGKYGKQHLIQPNSKPFYQYLNIFKFCYITFNKIFLNIISFNQLILTFDLLLNQIIIKQNHPLIRQYVQVLLGRFYLTIKQRANCNNQNIQGNSQNMQVNNQNKMKYLQEFNDCRSRMINMLNYDQQNVHNLNIAVPILMILGYQLINYLQNQQQLNKKVQIKQMLNQQTQQLPLQSTIQNPNNQQNKQENNLTKSFNQLDIHFILVKYISCHVAYMRTICQYYLSKYLQLIKTKNIQSDILLQNLVKFWHSDKDSIKIMNNIAIAVQGFKKQMINFNQTNTILYGKQNNMNNKQVNVHKQSSQQNSFYLGFERVQQYPSQQTKYFLNKDTIFIIQQIFNLQISNQFYLFKIKLAQKLGKLRQAVIIYQEQQRNIISQSLNIKQQSEKQNNTNKNNKNNKSSKNNNKNPSKNHKKDKLNQNTESIKKNINQIPKKQQKQLLISKPLQQPKSQIQSKPLIQSKSSQPPKTSLPPFSNLNSLFPNPLPLGPLGPQPPNLQQVKKFRLLSAKINKQYNEYQNKQQPKVIIIASLLQKVHNFGYLVRTLTSHNAMLVVPSQQPFEHPQCKQLLPLLQQIDVKVIQIKPKNLQSFIKMNQLRGYPLIALQQCSKSVELEKTVFPDKYMLLLGNQRIGAPASLLNMADILVQIPQVGKIRSLNVHVSMVICFWQYLKQAQSKNKQNDKKLNNQIKQS